MSIEYPGGLRGKYYANTRWEGNPAIITQQQIPFLKGQDGKKIVSASAYSVRWSGYIRISRSGQHTFMTESDDGSLLRIDGRTIVDNGGAHGLRRVSGTVMLEKGVYPIELLYVQTGGYSIFRARWIAPGNAEEAIPPRLLFPKYPTTIRILRQDIGAWMAQYGKYLGAGWLICAILFGGWTFLQAYCRHLTPCDWACVALLCGATFGISYFSPVDYAEFDPFGTLLTSQSLLHGTIKLDDYQDIIPRYPWQIQQKNGHFYYHYPIGTPLLVTPVVYVANAFGKDMARRDDEIELQNVLSAFTTMFASFLVYLIGRHYVSSTHNMLLCVAFVGGSSFISTMGSALYNINCSVIFVLICLLFLTADDLRRQEMNPYLFGFFLFLAYLCRPTAALFIFFASIYLFYKKGKRCFKSIGIFAFFFSMFIVFSWKEYHQVLPDYYLLSKLGPSGGNFWLAVYGNVLSPMRGILIYSPFLLFPLLGSLRYFTRLRRIPLYWLSLGWFAAHLAVISRNFMWWGGASLGNRLFTDGVPSLFLLTLIVWNLASQEMSAATRRGMITMFAAFTGLALFLNAYQGLYNPSTIDWGADPAHLFDWEHPQFLASYDRLAAREMRDQIQSLAPYVLGEQIKPGTRNAIFSGWYWVEGNFRWSRGHRAKILFTVPSQMLPRDEPTLRLRLHIGAYGKQRIAVALNGKKIGEISHDSPKPSTYLFSVDRDEIQSDGQYNDIEFLLPDAVNPRHFYGKGWVRALAISFWWADFDVLTQECEISISPVKSRFDTPASNDSRNVYNP